MSNPSSSTISRSGNPKNRLPVYLGAAGAALVGYYFYTAGGDPQLARKEMKRESTSSRGPTHSELTPHAQTTPPVPPPR